MQTRNDPKQPFRTWYTILKYPFEWSTWWLGRASKKLIDCSLFISNEITNILLPIFKITFQQFENIVKKFIDVLSYISRNYIPVLNTSTCDEVIVNSKKFKKHTLILQTEKEDSNYGVLYIIDSAKRKIRLGIIYINDQIRSVTKNLRERYYYLNYQVDICAYKLKVRSIFSITQIRDFLSLLVYETKEYAKFYFNESTKQAIKGYHMTLNRAKEGYYITVDRVQRSYVVCKESSKQWFQYTIDRWKKFGNSVLYSISDFTDNIFYSITSAPLYVYLYFLVFILFMIYFTYEVLQTYQGELYHRSLIPDEKIREGCKAFMLENVTLKEIMKRMLDQIHKGLDHKTRESSSVKCYVTYVQDLPTGKEKGKFLALDLGGTNFRVLLIKLDGRHYEMQSKIYAIPKEIMTGPGTDLFDHIASCLENFAKEHKVNNEKLPLGFTFSFPLRQEGLCRGVLTSWTKGFQCDGVIGEDVVVLLKQALQRKTEHSHIDIIAILNDTTGTLMSCAWKNHNCKVGLILGTGSNACYVEKIENIPDFDGDKSKPHVIINTEWGAFGDKGELEFVQTSYDEEIDKNSINPGKQRHEKMISGMYLGEIVRQLIVKFAQEKILFGGTTSEQLLTRESFLTEYVSDIESDKRGSFKNCRNVLEKLGIHDVSDQDCANVRYICECVTRRAAHLASAGVATLVNKMQLPSVTVGVDGTLYRKHPYFHELMVDKISELVDPNIKHVSLMLSEDGSGRGAALIAAAGSD